jgi:hypothetical protein
MTTQTIYLSKRNLLTLLSKIDRQEQGHDTQCTLIKYRSPESNYQQTMDSINVVAVADNEYYTALQRLPGPVHPWDTP